MQKAPAIAASPETRLIPLNKLRVDERNVRSASGDPARVQADAELAASIKAHGLLENLVVVRRGKTLYGVAAGARRLRALKALAAEKHIPTHFPVPCLLVEGDAAAESSLAENAVRIAMHPADQVVAFSRLVREGATAEQIAARFGVSERTVQKRVRLGDLPDEVIAAYREGRINADTAEAFATTGDTDFQRAVFESLSQAGQLYGHNVRQALSQRQARSDAPAALFVGLDAYRAGGGTVEDPLFEDDFLTILDPNLMHELAQQKLNAEVQQYATAWKWTAVQLEFSWMDQQKHLVAGADVRADFTEDETDALNAAEALIEQASEALDDPAIDADARRKLWATVNREQRRYAEIERTRADRDEYSDTVRAHAGVVVALDREGNLDVHRGLVRAEDADAYRAATATASGGNAATGNGAVSGGPSGTVSGDPGDGAPAKKNGGYTDALRNDLRIMRTAAVRRALARDPAVATDLIAFVLARAVGFGRRQPRHESPVLALRQEYQGLYASDAMKASPAMNHLEPVPAVDLGWLAEADAAAAFRAYRALPGEDRASVLAHAVAALTVPHLADDKDVSGAHEEAVRNLGIDFSEELAAAEAKPFDADLVWNRMNKGLILGAAAETLGDDWATKHNGLKKKDLVAAAAEAFRHDPARDAAMDAAATRWLPPGFAPVEAAGDDSAQRTAEVPADDNADPGPDADDNAGTDPEPAAGNGTTDAPGDAGATDATTAEESADADGNGSLPAFLTS